MENLVQFKVFFYWGEEPKLEVRRFGIEKSVVTSFLYLQAKLQDIYPALKGKTFKVSWKDEEGDDVTISSDEEMIIALTNMSSGLTKHIKLNVHCKDQQPLPSGDMANPVFVSATIAPIPASAGQPEGPHGNVVCDGCDKVVVGFRYKCVNCVDYDLCSECEGAGMHPEHCMVRIPGPVMPRDVVKKAIKCSRKFLKTVSDPEERHKRRDRSSDRKHHHRGERPERREGRRPRGSWIETFTTYMNEFANLAGDVDCHPPATDKTQNTATNTEATGTKTCDINLDIILTPEQKQYISGLQKTLANILVPNLIPEQGTSNGAAPQSSAVVNNTSEHSANANTIPSHTDTAVGPSVGNTEKRSESANNVGVVGGVASATDVEMGQGDKAPEADKVSVNSSSSVNEPADKGDDWTMINKEQGSYIGDASADLMDVAGALAAAVPIGFNLPEEFQKRVRTTDNIYPPLHSTAAVLDPKVVEPMPPQPSAPQPSPLQPPRPSPAVAPQPAPRTPHRNPKIEAAIQQMLNMGFNNESGWLTQLLETYDGNIAAVLDVLTPVSNQQRRK